MISVGVDPGTASYDVVAIEGDKVVYASSLPSTEVRVNPLKLIEEIERSEAEIGAGLSGYGLPVKNFSEIDEIDIFLMTLNFEETSSIGLRKIIDLIRERNLNFYTIPGIIHLETVPVWRKMNKIDIGTADKLCSTVLAVYQLSQEIPVEKQNFILAEVGHGFTAFVGVKRGKIVDGIGGTSGFPGYSSMGSMDSELAYLLGSFPKNLIFTGGIDYFAKEWGLENAFEILAEYVLKGLRSIEVSVGTADLCVLSGRYAGNVVDRISEVYECVFLQGFGRKTEQTAAQGAALIANGIGGGEFREILEHMEIFSARGTSLDYLTSELVDHLRRTMKIG